MLEPADLYRALMVMRSDFDLLNEMVDRGTDLANLDRDALLRRCEGLQKHIALKAKDSEALLNDLTVVRRRFSGLEMLGFVHPVPDELLQAELASVSDMEGPESEVFKRIRALRLETAPEVVSDLNGVVSSCLAGYRVRLQKARAEVEALKADRAARTLLSEGEG